ncbi:MAG TPA: TadG family pilus assembly protein [Pirellulales bacterium]|nr:TadG family pilus assembly protein [Pirellulales bacterium]
MRHHTKNLKRTRKGAVAVLACLLMIAMLGLLAFAVDLGYLANSQTELQRTADAAALAACAQLVYSPTPGGQIDSAYNAQMAPGVATQYAAANKVCGAAPALSSSDVVIGYMPDPSQQGAIQTGGDPSQYNAVQVTVRRSTSENGLVPSFFGKIFGVTGEATSATATAAFYNNFNGFGIPSAVPPGSSQTSPSLMFLPYALDLTTWASLLSGNGSDNFAYTPGGCHPVTSGSDGVLEVNLFPQGTGSPGNRGTVLVGGNGTSTLVRQIELGLSPSDLASFGGKLQLDSTGNLYLPAKPGISAGTKDALAAIIGQVRIIPIFESISGNGGNATYDIVAFGGVRVMDVNLTGSMSSKHLTVQPAPIYTLGAIGVGGSGSSSNGLNTAGVYSPVFLVH